MSFGYDWVVLEDGTLYPMSDRAKASDQLILPDGTIIYYPGGLVLSDEHEVSTRLDIGLSESNKNGPSE